MKSDELKNRILLSIENLYSSEPSKYELVNLAETLDEWDNLVFEEKDEQEAQIYKLLQRLQLFLKQSNNTEASEKIEQIILSIFPERMFPDLPSREKVINLDTKPLDVATGIMKLKKFPEDAQNSFHEFREAFFKARKDFNQFLAEIKGGGFGPEGTGLAGDLYVKFLKTASQLQYTSQIDVPWSAMFQFAKKLNDERQKFLEAHLLLKTLEEIKSSFPTTELRGKIKKSSRQYLRNSLWDNLDKALADGNYSMVLKYAEKLEPLSENAADSNNLKLIKQYSEGKLEGAPRGCIIAIVLLVLAIGILPRFLSNQENSPLTNIVLKGKVRKSFEEEMKEPFLNKYDRGIKYISRAGLLEQKPPYTPHDRPLKMAEVRFVFFQKYRLEILKQKLLQGQFKQKLTKLIDDYQRRCDFFEASDLDKETVEQELKMNADIIKKETEEIVSQWENELGISSKLTSLDTETKVRKTNFFTEIEKVQYRLFELGYYKGKIDGLLNEATKDSITMFKLEQMGLYDANLDSETKKLLFGK